MKTRLLKKVRRRYRITRIESVTATGESQDLVMFLINKRKPFYVLDTVSLWTGGLVEGTRGHFVTRERALEGLIGRIRTDWEAKIKGEDKGRRVVVWPAKHQRPTKREVSDDYYDA